MTVGVTLDQRTIVTVKIAVINIFSDGICILAGVSIKVVKNLDKDKFLLKHLVDEHYRYIPPKVYNAEKKTLIYLICQQRKHLILNKLRG